MAKHTKVDSIAFFFFKAASSSAMAAVCAFLASAGGPDVLIVLELKNIKTCLIRRYYREERIQRTTRRPLYMHGRVNTNSDTLRKH